MQKECQELLKDKIMNKRSKAFIFLLCAGFVLCGCSQESPERDSSFLSEEQIEAQNELASHDPYEPYGQTITYNLAKLTGLNNMPEGDTYTNNAYTRVFKDMLNVQNIDILEADETKYYNTLDLYISSGELPDVMVLDDYSQLQYLAENDMIADLSQAYEECTTDRIKEIYASYGDEILENVTFDGKLMAMPSTNIGNGPNLLWIRQDWLDKLGLDQPKTMDELFDVLRAFVEQDPQGNGQGNTIGLAINSTIAGQDGYAIEFGLDSIFSMYDTALGKWVYDEEGNLAYSSCTSQSKAALQLIHDLYQEGLIDQNFALRTQSNINEEIIAGRCGAFFGPWWSSNNPLVDAKKADPDSEWVCLLLPSDEDGTVTFYNEAPSSQYVVVSKEYEHPEIVCKILSVQFDYLRFEMKDNEEINKYDELNVDQTAKPLVINVDYAKALQYSHENIVSVIEGESSLSDVPNLDASYAKACLDYLEDEENADPEDWAAYMSRVAAPSLFDDDTLNAKASVFYGTTPTMSKKLLSLQQYENQMYIQMIVEQDGMDLFDEFVEGWMAKGGQQILLEISEQIESN
jgi:putative aldouronate transport system substrate-binding protein